MAGTFYFFLNRTLAGGFGHIGWGYTNPDGSISLGSTDHRFDVASNVNWSDKNAFQQAIDYAVKYMCTPLGANNDPWRARARTVDEALAAMRDGTGGTSSHFSYQMYKTVPVDNPNAANAAQKEQAISQDGWCLKDRNCLDHTTAVAEAYGVHWNNFWPIPGGGPMPWKQTNFTPNMWFDALLPGTERALLTDGHVLSIKAHSGWKAEIVIDVGCRQLHYMLEDDQTLDIKEKIPGSGTLCIHAIPRGGKPIENLDPTGHVSYDVTCALYLDGSTTPLCNFHKNGWDPKGTVFSGPVVHYS